MRQRTCRPGRRACRTRAADDCATELVEKICSTAWQHKVVANHVRNALREWKRRRAHEVAWPQTKWADGSVVEMEVPADLPPIDSRLMNEEFWKRLREVIELLPSVQKQFFLWHHFGGVSIENLAAYSGKSRKAVEAILRRARARLRVLLPEYGLTEAELRDYFV